VISETASAIGSCRSRVSRSRSDSPLIAVDQRHDVVQQISDRSRVIERQNVRVLKLGGDTNFPQESVGSDHRRQLGPQHLHRHFAIVLHVGRAKDDGHATGCDLVLEAISGGEIRVEPREEIDHGVAVRARGA
jgi:hypothetical protein